MWKTALMRSALAAVPVVALGLWAQRVTVQHTQDATQQRAEAVAQSARAQLGAAEAALRRELRAACRFDRRSARLLTELRSDVPPADIRRSVRALSRSFSLDSLRVVGPRGEGRLAVADTPPSDGPDVHVALQARCRLDAELSLVAGRHVALPPPPGDVAQWLWSTVPRSDDAILVRVWPPSPPAPGQPSLWLRTVPPDRPVAAVQAGTALCLVLAIGLALFGTPRRDGGPAEATALSAIEAAAERVAKGDLISNIGVRTGTAADQTLTAFNRMTEELRLTREKLVRAERAATWQDMARRIAHEIKNPLSPIRTAMETLRRAHARRLDNFDEIFEESSLAVLEEVQRLQRIVREFSEFARLPRPSLSAIDLRDTAAHAATVARHDGVPVELVAPERVPGVRGDREQLTQVLLNLLQNAGHAAQEARREGARVELRLQVHAGHVEVSVDDNGPGVPEALREQVFEPYFTQSEHGSGLGLSIASRIVEEHGGTLTVQDSPLGGAAFGFALALAEGSAQAVHSPPPMP